ncbi:MAG: hypothetical protein EHM65_09530 [Acidobacteriales bacterium]|nr:MAG: hypothetical protein EHM65_09530 [Terriglobales bacterium]
MRTEGYSVDQCLARYPEQAAQLRPLLVSAERLSRGRAVTPSTAFKAATRARLIARAEASRPRTSFVLRPAWQFAMAIALLALVMLASTTAVAQDSLPGEPLYGWKLNSEHVWRSVATDRVSVDLTLADRRATELTRVARSGPLEQEARNEYHEVLSRLEAEIDSENGAKIDQALLAHQKKLSQAGLRDEKLDDLVKGKKK